MRLKPSYLKATVATGAMLLLHASTACVHVDVNKSPSLARQSTARTAQAFDYVDPADYKQHVAILAHDALTGRGIGTPGIDLAAGYIAGQFASIGILPGAADGSYFQEFETVTGSSLAGEGEFSITGAEVTATFDVDYAPFPFSNSDAFAGDVVFVGYGITAPDRDHDDYAELDVSRKVLLMLRREPPDWDSGRGTRHASFRNKVYAARDKGATAVLIVDRVGDGEGDRLTRFEGGSGDYGLPAFHVSRKLADSLLSAGRLPTLETLQATVDAGEFASAPLAGIHIEGKANIVKTLTQMRNVVGLIPGSGKNAHEYVVIGGHYDHLGLSVSRMSFGRSRDETREPEIHNGADDNASGTAGIIEAGRVLTRQMPLNRSVLLVAFSGEETGLHGSKFFVDNPPVPLDDIVAMLNMDMIGRLNPDERTLQIYGTKAAEEFDEMITRLTGQAGFQLRGDESALGPSDHTSFYQKGIPSVHIFTGLHEDYHRPGDDTEKVNVHGGAEVTQLVAAMAKEIIDRPAPPTYFAVTTRANIFSQQSGMGMPRVVMGVMPAYADSGDAGMAVDGVYEDGPAGKAGMKQGDRILKIGPTSIANVQDYMGALRDNKPGDVVDVVVNRGTQQLTIKVTLEGR